MNELAQSVALVGNLCYRFDGDFKNDLMIAIKLSEDFSDNEKLMLCYAIKNQTSLSKLLELVLTSDFTYLGFDESLVPTVDNSFRNKVLVVMKESLLSKLTDLEASLTTFQNTLTAVSDEDLYSTLTS